jgi:hypothetical protein
MQDHASRQSDTSGIPTKLNVPLGVTPKTPAKCQGAARNGGPKAKSHRVIARVSEELYQALMARSRDLGCDLSHVVRSALVGNLTPETGSNTPRKPLMRPEEIDPLLDYYRAIVHTDIRQERKRLFGHLLAASYIAKVNFPRTPGMIDGYQALLELLSFFGYPENV